MGYVEDFLAKWVPIAQSESKRSGIPASVILAQGALESDWGRSDLTTHANNYFGIKANKGYAGESKAFLTTEEVNGKKVKVWANFRDYRTPEQSWIDHTDFLLTNPRYQKYGVFSTNDPYEVAQALQRAGYATSSTYADDLMKVIKGRNMTQYDTGAAPIFTEDNPAPPLSNADKAKDWAQNNGLGFLPSIGAIWGGAALDVKENAQELAVTGATKIGTIVAVIILIVFGLFVIIKMVGGNPVAIAKTVATRGK